MRRVNEENNRGARDVLSNRWNFKIPHFRRKKNTSQKSQGFQKCFKHICQTMYPNTLKF